MPDLLSAIEADFATLAKHLTLIIEGHEDDPEAAVQIEQLRAAFRKATEAAELIRAYREHGNP